MTYTEIKQRKEKRYYYRGKSVRRGKKVDKERVYLGVNLSKEKLKELEEKADEKLLGGGVEDVGKESVEADTGKRGTAGKEKGEKRKEEEQTLGITVGKEEFSEWFTQLMVKADLADYTDVSGSIVFKPTSYTIWEKIKEECDKRFRKLGIKNSYFPLLIPEKLLRKEQEHVEGFIPEVAWVTQAGNTKFAEKLAIRPTSEAIMYPSYSKWIRSWRDLPLKLNQWNNVVRWEFKHPVPFFRTREFLWNEGHSAFATEKEALSEQDGIFKTYKEVCEEFLALYSMIGRKTEKEKFAGAVFSEKLHFIIPNGRATEGPCFHHDGQNFAKAYDIQFLNEKKQKEYVWQNTYAISTRMLGVMFAIHSDSKGLILPPKVAPEKIVIIPIFSKKEKSKILKQAEEIQLDLEEYNAILDSREDLRPGFKFNKYELRGIPIRIEIGPRDLKEKQVIVVRRDNNEKQAIKVLNLKKEIPKILESIQLNLLKNSEKLFKSKVETAENLEKLKSIIQNKKVGISPLCKDRKCEEELKFETKGAKALFIDKKAIKSEKCIICRKKADYFIYVARTY